MNIQSKYDKAEDVLFKMITTNKKAKIVDEGFAFYKRLKGKTSIELENGNLPLDEVIEGTSFGPLGVGMGYAIAAKLAHPEKKVIMVTGDGAFGYGAMEYDKRSAL